MERRKPFPYNGRQVALQQAHHPAQRYNVDRAVIHAGQQIPGVFFAREIENRRRTALQRHADPDIVLDHVAELQRPLENDQYRLV